MKLASILACSSERFTAAVRSPLGSHSTPKTTHPPLSREKVIRSRGAGWQGRVLRWDCLGIEGLQNEIGKLPGLLVRDVHGGGAVPSGVAFDSKDDPPLRITGEGDPIVRAKLAREGLAVESFRH